MSALTLTRGDSREWSGQIRKRDANGVLQPYPIAGTAELRFTAKAALADVDGDAIIVKTWLAGTPAGLFVDDAGAGEYRVTVAPADTADLEGFARLDYDVQIKDATGTWTVDRGTISVSEDVTQAA